MPLSLRRSIQEFFVLTDGYSAANHFAGEKYCPNWSKEFIRALKHEKLIELCAGYFEEKGYRAKINSQHDKEFIDVWLFKESYSGEQPFGIIKCWETKALPVESIHLNPFSNIVTKNDVPLGVFITVGKYSYEATKYKDKRLQLIDGNKLLSLIKALPEVRKQRLLDKVE